jgi:two-component system OmpR family sensor kinase
VTLRGRLIAGLVALFAIGCATVGMTTYIAARNSLLNEIRGQLQTATGIWSHCLSTAEMVDGQPSDPPGPQDPGGHGSQVAASVDALDPPVSCDGPGTFDNSLGLGTFDNSLGPGTFEATIYDGKINPYVVDHDTTRLSGTDKETLRHLPVTTPPPPGNQSQSPTYVRSLGSLGGSYVLTAVKDHDGDTTCIIGLPLGGVYDTLHDLAVTELVVFGLVLLLAGVLGTGWVGLSLRPLRRVAATASQVAELPLESGEVEFPAGVPDTDPRTETGQLGAAFNRMLGHVQTALARRNASETRLRRFAADASHELRTPLAAIRGYAELALRHPGDSPEQVMHALRRVLSESTRMTVLVDDLLLLARLDAGRPLNREPVDMSRVTIDATSDARVARSGHRWILDLPDDPVMVIGDEHRLQQVLVNLLSNAGRHTPEGTTVTVRLSVGQQPGVDEQPGSGRPGPDDRGGGLPSVSQPGAGAHAEGAAPAGTASVRRGVVPAEPHMTLTVTDDGPGIPPGLLPELFERFTRADTARSHASDPSSTGLGLAIVDAVVAAHAGAVQVSSRPGMTRFAIILPRLREQREGAQRRIRPTRRARV